MSDPTIDDQQAQLLDALDEAIQLLRRFSIDRWADWLENDRSRIDGGDTAALDHLLSAFGGMGSLNDVVIYTTTHQLPHKGTYEVEANEQLYDCRDRIWGLAKALKRELA